LEVLPKLIFAQKYREVARLNGLGHGDQDVLWVLVSGPAPNVKECITLYGLLFHKLPVNKGTFQTSGRCFFSFVKNEMT